jgi:hypothetical protein
MGKCMRNSNFDPHVQISEMDAKLEQFERQAVVMLTSVSALLMLAVTGYSLLLGAHL